jgi:ubiquitin carboxyl-terminal hydrolase 4/11/15
LAWSDYTSRNSSIITDLFGGQYRSEVSCTQCGKVSVTFDPFLTLHLNIPSDSRQELDITYVPAAPEHRAVKLKFLTSSHPSVQQLKQEVADALGKDIADLRAVFITNNIVQDWAPSEAGGKGSLYFYEALVSSSTAVWVNISKRFPQSPDSQIADSYPRLIGVQPQASLKAVHLEVFRHLMRSVKDGRIGGCQETLDDEPSLVSQFELSFPSLLGQPGVDLYTLKVSNYPRGSSPCEVCSDSYCRGCALPYTDYKLTSERVLLDAVFTLSHQWLTVLRQTVDHSSVSEMSLSLSKEHQRQLTLYECFEYTGQPENLDEDNTLYCSKCVDQVKILKKIEVWSVPRLLLIVLKRFKHQGVLMSKVNKVVQFPIEGLDLDSYVLGDRPGIYDLYAVSNHIGSLGYGHSTAYAKHEGKWYELDDSRVTIPTRNLESSGAAYVLCYQRRDS